MSNFIKKIIYIVGLLLVTLVFIINIIYTSTMRVDEVITVKTNTLLFLLDAIILAIVIIYLCKELKAKSNKIRKKYLIFGLVIFLYVTMQIVVINYKSSKPVADQYTTYELAIAMKNDNVKEFINNNYTYEDAVEDRIYIERYQQQIPLAFIWSIIFRIFNSTDYKIIESLNVLGNTATLISIYLICKELSKKYNVNKYLGITLIAMFWSIPVLCTFIYGDFSSLGLAMLGTYFVMRYCNERKLRYIIYFITCISLAYILRMNTLIFFLAILIYLFLDLIKKKDTKQTDESDNVHKSTNYKLILSKIVTIICFIAFTFGPAGLIKNYYLKQADLDKNKAFPALGYFYMGMTVSTYGSGWYTYRYADYALHDFENANAIYKDLINKRLNYFKQNPQYTFRFYLSKICSMWTENNHSSIRKKIILNENQSAVKDISPQGVYDAIDVEILQQKALILIIFGCTLIVLIQNRNNLSNEVILLLTIFIGGFLFHLIWEAKSRYIIPYIIVLIPIASIEIRKFRSFKKKKGV